MATKKSLILKEVDTITHATDRRANIPTAEFQAVMKSEDTKPVTLSYEKRNPDLDPQLVWRGKYDGDDSLTVQAPPIYIQEKVHPKVLINDLMVQSKKEKAKTSDQYSLFGDFNGIREGADKTDFYKHDQNWTNRMILGDSLQVMASLAEREGLRGKVQCIFMDPPYGIKFNSNFQWSTTSPNQKDGKDITREPEQIKAFRDTWRDGIHSYLSYLRDRFIIAQDLLSDSGSIFVQIGDANVHHVREVLEEIFGEKNFYSQITYSSTSGLGGEGLAKSTNYILWFAKDIESMKYRQLFRQKLLSGSAGDFYKRIELENGLRMSMTEYEKMSNINSVRDACNKDKNKIKFYRYDNITSANHGMGVGEKGVSSFYFEGKHYTPGKNTYKTHNEGMHRLKYANRIATGGTALNFIRYFDDFTCYTYNNMWTDTGMTGFGNDKVYVVQTGSKIIERCILMATDPGDLVLDPTCGSGTTAYVAEQWGRRWITIDTSRVALALARARIMGARYSWYLMADSKEGKYKEAELSQIPPKDEPTYNNIKHGFVYERVPHITLKSIANNAEIDVIYDKWQKIMEPLRETLNKELGEKWEEWEIPRGGSGEYGEAVWGESKWSDKWSAKAKEAHEKWWKARISRQKEIDASIAAKADYEYLYDKPYEDKKRVRVAGPFTVESLSPHRVLGIDADGELLDPATQKAGAENTDFAAMILENLKISGVQQSHKQDKIDFTSITPWPGNMISAEARYMAGDTERRAAIFIGPEFGTVTRQDLVRASVEAAEANFDILVSCAFSYEARATEFVKNGRVEILKATMNADLHMGDALKNTGKGNLFVVFGEPDIDILPAKDKNGNDTGKICVKINGVDVFYPNTGEIRSDNSDGIACWFVDSDYNDESFFVRQAYFLGANDPYKALKTTLKAEIDSNIWETLHSDTSRPFDKPASGRIAVKVINHLGDEVMKVFDCN